MATRISMGRRQAAESVNAALKGSFVDLARGFFRVFGQVKMTVLLGFTLAAYNLDRIRSFSAKQSQHEDELKSRTTRRRGMWADLVVSPAEVIPARAADAPGYFVCPGSPPSHSAG